MSRSYMTLFSLAVVLAISLTSLSAAEVGGLSFGFSIGDRHGDLCLSIEGESAAFLNKILSLKAGAEYCWKEGSRSAAVLWDPYYLGRIGLVLNSAYTDYGRLYGELGGVAILCQGESELQSFLGIYGLFGFEFSFSRGSQGSYFIELGSTGSFNAIDSRLDGRPLLANGYSSRAGFRWKL